MMKKSIAILLSFLMIFQMLPVATIAEGLQENTGTLQPAESNDIEGVDVEEVFEVNFALDDEADQAQDSGQKRFFSEKSNRGKGSKDKTQGRGAEARVRRHGEKIGKLPDAPKKKHLYGWVDKKSKKYVTENTLVTSSMTLSPVGMNEEALSLSAGGVSVEVPADSVPENTEFSAVPVSAESVAAAVESVVDEVGEIRAVDLTFTDTNIDEEVEPAKAVQVTMSVAGMDTTSLTVLHIKDDGSKEIIPFTLNGETVIFSAESFSVYVVIETNVPRLTVKFMNGDTELAIMYLKAIDDTIDGEVEKIIYDPGAGTIPEGQVFKGWTTSPDNPTDLMTIDEVRTDAATRARALTDEDGEVTYYAVLYKHISVTYVDVDDTGSTPVETVIGMEDIELPSSAEETDYTVNMGYTVDDSHKLLGWQVREGAGNIKDHPTEDAKTVNIDGENIIYYPNDTGLTITGPVTFSVFAPKGSWLIFNENGKGATYNASQFILVGETTEKPEQAENGNMKFAFRGNDGIIQKKKYSKRGMKRYGL